MMRLPSLIAVILLFLMLTGCTTVPVTVNFPDAPGTLVKEACPNLKKHNEESTLSDVAKTVTENYTSYYECAVKLDAWVKWYDSQKTIFQSIK